MRIKTLNEVETSFEVLSYEDSKAIAGGRQWAIIWTLGTNPNSDVNWVIDHEFSNTSNNVSSFVDDSNSSTIGGGSFSYYDANNDYITVSTTGYGDPNSGNIVFAGIDLNTGYPLYCDVNGGYIAFNDASSIEITSVSGNITTYFDKITGEYYNVNPGELSYPSPYGYASFYQDSDAYETGGGGYLRYLDSNGNPHEIYSSPFNGPEGDANFSFYSVDPVANTITYRVTNSGTDFLVTISDRSNLIFGPSSGVSGYQDWDSSNPGDEMVYFDTLTGGYIMTRLDGYLLG